MKGFDNYLAEPQRQKLSSLYNTVSDYFDHVLLLPGQKIFFLCSAQPFNIDIPALLDQKNIRTRYIRGYYYGNLTRERIERLNPLMDRKTPKNTDYSPQLMRLMFPQWFAKFSASPTGFMAVLSVLCLIYLIRISAEEFVLFSTGWTVMGSEILVIFAFQIFFGYIYFQIGLIVTVFLAGLLPGAWFGERMRYRSKTDPGGCRWTDHCSDGHTDRCFETDRLSFAGGFFSCFRFCDFPDLRVSVPGGPLVAGRRRPGGDAGLFRRFDRGRLWNPGHECRIDPLFWDHLGCSRIDRAKTLQFNRYFCEL